MTEKTLEIDKGKERDEVKKLLDEVIAKQSDKIPPQALPLIKETFTKIFADHLSPKEAMGLTPEVMEVFYQQGYLFFQSGKFKEALQMFDFLRLLDVKDKRYTFAIAACYQYMKEYLNAAANYILYKTVDPFNPIPSFHLYDCFMGAHYPETALYYLEEARILTEEDPRYAGLKNKIELELGIAKDLLKNRYQEKFGNG